jgi:hypothetical protein
MRLGMWLSCWIFRIEGIMTLGFLRSLRLPRELEDCTYEVPCVSKRILYFLARWRRLVVKVSSVPSSR